MTHKLLGGNKMEKELSSIGWRTITRLLTIGVIFALFAYVYAVVLIFASASPMFGNLALAILILGGALVLSVSIRVVNKRYDYVGIKRRFSPGRIAAVVVALVIWHAVGIVMPTPGLQLLFVFTPVYIVGIGLLLGLLYLLDKGAKTKYDSKL